MRGVIVWLLASACNQTFDLRPTQLIDAPGPDAPFSCPLPGSRLAFSRLVHQTALRDYSFYSLSEATGKASALSQDSGAIVFGDADGPLNATGLVSSLSFQYDEPHLSAEADELWLHELDSSSRSSTFAIYRPGSGGSWARAAQLPVPTTSSASTRLAGPTARAHGPRRFLAMHLIPSFGIDEYVEDGSGGWSPPVAHDASELGLTSAIAITLSRDGLRLIIAAESADATHQVMLYTDRAQVGAPFRAASLEPTLPIANDTYLDDDCSRVYASGLGWVFYAQQQ